ncbi:hypothetical protein SAMN05660686_02429 [Thalassobaculum litoreum DSM 18839]|uniref:Uncharacterized protein n=2 Tax=Thalassobaculum TaxID=526215 RepID=A0A8G2EVD6_9PROT|nr:hypothetical protein SAMN05660686_02429 [Thalassobaculum litoreum DSM 18839]
MIVLCIAAAAVWASVLGGLIRSVLPQMLVPVWFHGACALILLVALAYVALRVLRREG